MTDFKSKAPEASIYFNINIKKSPIIPVQHALLKLNVFNLFQVKSAYDNNLAYISQQLAMLREKMLREQVRLKNIIEEKDKKIKSQDRKIMKLKSVIELQKSQVVATKPCTCDSNTTMEKTKADNLYSNYRGNTVSLRRQPKFTKGSERPSSVSKIRQTYSCQNISLLGIEKNPKDASDISLKLSENHFPVNSQALTTQKPNSYIISDKDSGFGSFRSSPVNSEEYPKPEDKRSTKAEKYKRRERRKTVSIQLHHLQQQIIAIT